MDLHVGGIPMARRECIGDVLKQRTLLVCRFDEI